MNRIKRFTLVVLALGSAAVFAAKDSSFKIQNSVRVGYDDNVYQSGDNEQDTAFISDIANISGTLTFSDRSEMELYWQPEFRTWEDDAYGEWDPTIARSGNDYDQLKANGSFVRELNKGTTYGLVGVNYLDHEYDGARGGFNSTTLYGGVDQIFSPNLSGTAQLGYSFSSVDSSDGTVSNSEDTSSPFLQAGLDYKAAERTSINGSLGYSLSQSQNSIYNASDAFDVALGVRHDLTGKITLSSTLSYVFSLYDSAYSAWGLEDAEEDYIRFNVRGSYQINRNNFVDVGYEFSYRDSDSDFLQEYTRNRFDIGWRLRL